MIIKQSRSSKNELLQRVDSWIALRRLVLASHEEAKTRAVLVKTTPSNIVPAVLKDPKIVTKLENVITMVIYLRRLTAFLKRTCESKCAFSVHEDCYEV